MSACNSASILDDRPTCTIYHIQKLLGRQDYGMVKLRKYITLLIAERGFPPPLPHYNQMRPDKARRHHRADGTSAALVDAVDAGSRWRRDAVECWLDDFLPPANAAALDDRARRLAADDMDARAASLALVQGGRAA